MEILIVISIMTVLLGMGGALAAKFANRRSVDRVTTTIASTLQVAKLKAARQGVEYQVSFAFDPDQRDLTIVTEIGDSNNGSTTFTEESSQTIKVQPGITIDPPNQTFTFNPSGTTSSEINQEVNLEPDSDKKGDRCGVVTASVLGRVANIQGNWDPSEDGMCKAIK